MQCILTKYSHKLLITDHELFVLWILHHHDTNSQHTTAATLQCQHLLPPPGAIVIGYVC